MGDAMAIPGDYQYRAMHSKSNVQRSWHQNKKVTISRYLPPASGDHILDVGCGSGVISDFLGESGAEVLGIDANQDAIAFAQAQFRRPNVRFQLGYVDEEYHPPWPVDKIYCMEVIEHVYQEQFELMLNTFAKSLKSQGRVFITCPNQTSLWPFIERLLDVSGAVPRLKDEQHVEKYTIEKLTNIVKKAGFEVESVHTSCFLGPWMALLSWSLAEKLHEWEAAPGRRWGSILVFVLRKP
jgi:2-polyprenyl-3-methyl-5-hydroxy-6-metoxy-1,4-benzoquinol methylase